MFRFIAEDFSTKLKNVLNFVGLVCGCQGSCGLHGSKIFFRGYFVGPKFLLVVISWVTREYVSKAQE